MQNTIKKYTSLLLILTGLSCNTALYAQQQGMPPATVEVADVLSQKLAPTVAIPGNVISKNHGWLSAETTGKIMSIIDRGERVKKGDVVATIDTTTLKAQRREQQSNIKAQEAQIIYLRSQVKRLNELRAQNIAAVSQLEETQSNLDSAISNKAAAEARLQQVNIGIAASSIKAQFDGTVTEHQMQKGEHVTPGQRIIRIIDLDNKEVVALTSIDNISAIAVGDSIEVAAGNKRAHITLGSAVPYGEITEGVYELRFDLEDSAFRLGQSVRLNMPQTEGESVLAVPRDAIILRSNGSSVYKVNEDNSTTRINVKTGVGNNNLIAITDENGEIKQGDRVIVRGAERLRPGQPITIKNQ